MIVTARTASIPAAVTIALLGAATFTSAQQAYDLPPDAEHALTRLAESPRHGEWVEYGAGDADTVTAWLVYPERSDRAPVVIVIHEIFGLTDWVRGVADQLAADGFIAIAPDLLSGKGAEGGGTVTFSPDDVRRAIRDLDRAEVNRRLQAAAAYATALPAATSRVASIGFCWGGSTSFRFATAWDGLSAAVVYYGTSPPAEALASTAGPVLGLYGGDDARVNATIEPAETEMANLGKAYDIETYEGAGHGFLRQQSGRDGANLRASEAAWPRTVEFLRRELSSAGAPAPSVEPRAETPGVLGGRAQAFDPEAAAERYLSSLPAETAEKSEAYTESGYWLGLLGFLYGLAVAWFLLNTRLSARMRDLAERLSRRRPLQTALYVVQYILATTLLLFPLTVYGGFIREHRYEFSTQTFGAWFSEALVALLVSLVLATALLVVLYGVIRRAPRTWWIWGSGVSLAFLAIVTFIAPVYIAPLFNDYTPLEEGPLKERVLSLARANGVPADEVYQYDASRQTTRIGAFVTGFLGTTRIGLSDNLLEGSSDEEVEAVVAHEIGHFALRVTYEYFTFFAIVLVVGFAFVRWGFGRALGRWGSRWGVRDVGDIAGLPLFLALISVYLFALTPITNGFIRSNEVEADLYGLNAARQPDGFAEIILKLGEYRKVDPGPLEEWLLFDHPSARNRILMAMRWKAENLEGR